MAAWKKWLNSQPFAIIEETEPMTLDEIRMQVMATLAGCDGPMCERMRWRMDSARTAQDLWLLRGEIFQLVSSQHCQAVAAARINGLIPAFEGSLPPRMLTEI
jgi:hypothetical protein